MIDTALGFDTPESCILHSCSVCFYTLKDEPDLWFSCLVSIDGKNSLKQFRPKIMKHKEWLDSHHLSSDWWILIEEVDKLKDEVKVSNLNFYWFEPLLTLISSNSKKGPYVDPEDDV